MRTNFFTLLFIILISTALSQQINIGGTGKLNTNSVTTIVKSDAQGLPVIVTLGADGRFYALKSQNDKLSEPIPIAFVPFNIDMWDFDIDLNGAIHIGGISVSSQGTLVFYINSLNGTVSNVYFDSLKTLLLSDGYIRVLRTTDNQIYINYAYLIGVGFYVPGSELRWIQLINPDTSNLNKIVNTIDLSYYQSENPTFIYSANKNLFLNIAYGHWIFLDPYVDPDTFYAAYRTYKITNNGEMIVLGGGSQIHGTYDNNFLVVPISIADNNDNRLVWLWGKYRNNVFSYTPYSLGLFELRSSHIDNYGNLHLLKKINNQLFYSVYNPSNLPINQPGNSPYREILIPEQKLTYRSFPIWDYATDNVLLHGLNSDKAFILFPDLNELNSTKMLNVGSVILRLNNGNIESEFIFTAGNDEIPAGSSLKWLKRNNKNYFMKLAQYDSIDVNTGRFYFFPINYESGKLTSNLKENEIVKIDFPQLTPSVRPQTFKTDRNGLMHVVSIRRDTTRFIAGREDYGRYYLTKETSPGVWIQQFISKDTVAINYNRHGIDIDKYGIVHFVYSYNYKIFYTNNSPGYFQNPIQVDSILGSFYFFVDVRANSTDSVYILAKVGSGTYALYSGNYNSNFTKSNVTFTGTWPPVFEVDKNNNAFIFNTDYTYYNGQHEYYFYKFRLNNFIFRRKLISFTAMSQNEFSIDISRDQNGIIHLIAGYQGIPKLYYGNSSNDFSNLIEYNLMNYDAFNFYNRSSYTGTLSIHPVSDENRVYFTMVIGGGNNYIFPSLLGWLPYNLTSVETAEKNYPDNYKLYQNYPNPFNPSTKFKFFIPEKSEVKIEIFNSIGELVYQFPVKIYEAGNYEEVWNGIGTQNLRLPSGIYFLRFNAKSLSGKTFTDIKKMVLIK